MARTKTHGLEDLPSEDISETQDVIIQARVLDPAERQGGMRLNATMKREVVERALDHAYNKRSKALEAEHLALGTACYRKCFSPATIKHALALGQPWVRTDIDVYGKQAAYNTVQFAINGQYHYLPVPSTLPVPAYVGGDDKKFYRVNDAALAERVSTYISAMQKLHVERTKTEATLGAMLSRITTYPSLEKNWPAGKQFYKHLPQAYPYRHQVPAIMIDELNAALGV